VTDARDAGRRPRPRAAIGSLAAGVAASWLAFLGCDLRAETQAAAQAAVAREPQGADPSGSAVSGAGLWISRDEIRTLPMRGTAWQALVEHARAPASRPDLSDQDDPTNVRVLARALCYARTGDGAYAREVVEAIERVQGTESGASALAVSRELMAYVIAADLVGLDAAARTRFEAWLRSLSSRSFEGRTIRSTHEDRPNNWGTHAGATRVAIALYLRDREELERAAAVFRGWTGEADGWRRFEFGEDWWQPETGRRFAVNPRGALRAGHPIGGVLPDDQRRGGPFAWPPPREGYVWEALQGAVAQAVLLERAGYDAFEWGDRALLRAVEWLHVEARFPAEGDDTWIPHIVNRVYGSDFPAPVPSHPGKAMGFGDWTHGPRAVVKGGRVAAPTQRSGSPAS